MPKSDRPFESRFVRANELRASTSNIYDDDPTLIYVARHRIPLLSAVQVVLVELSSLVSSSLTLLSTLLLLSLLITVRTKRKIICG